MKRITRNALVAVLLGGCTLWSAQAQTTIVTGTRDFGGASLGTSCNGSSESQAPVVLVRAGGVVRNLRIRAGGGADGIHCQGTCRLENVVWEDVCEDAATALGGSGTTMTVTGGSAANAADKIFQHNGVGGAVSISNFAVNGSNGKLYRSCGNCPSQGRRTVNMSGITINGSLSSGMAGVNKNYGDVATIRSVRWRNWNSTSNSDSASACIPYNGVTSGSSQKLPPEWGTATCNVRRSDITRF
ncbi:pectate lyase [Aquabacterium sp.]|uniref:pectate lyase n=1 Tax=Aquabacterium sp. TaxID=1872578 RepID=UPI002CBAE510|nr:pectate lyase [Aquabacterium sp.]HSW06135.1 pectate lyase [Aquabacterium sp.]